LKPYYSEDGVTIYHGDCREVLPSIDRPSAIVTDPPFGTGWVRGGGRVGEFKAKHEQPDWDRFSVDWITLAPGVRSWVVFSPPSRCADTRAAVPVASVVHWLKTNPRPNGYALEPIIVGPGWLPEGITFAAYNGDTPHHPCQKPQELMAWCLRFVDPVLDVVDPFMGSGTTLRAAKDLGRRAIGIEIEERYCEIAAKRLAQKVLFVEPDRIDPSEVDL